MRTSCWLAMILVLGGCSCDRRPDGETPGDTAPAKVQAAPPVADPAPSTAPASALTGQTSSVSESVSTVHAYLGAVASKDWARADAYWAGGKPPPRPDDFAVRGLEELRSMRINNESPKPLDRQSPPQSVEIPVILRVRKDDGAYEISGWYRLRRKVGGDGWEITSASMQPTLG